MLLALPAARCPYVVVPKQGAVRMRFEIRALLLFFGADTVATQFNTHFAEFYGWFEDGLDYYLAMEYFPHGTLLDYFRASPVPVPEPDAILMVTQILEGVSIIHENNYAHLDLKPSVGYLPRARI